MNNEHIQRILKGVADSLEGSADFVLTQAPEVIQQLILLKRVECSLFLCISVAMIALLTWGSYQCIQKVREAHDEQNNEQDGAIMAWVIATVFTIFGAGVSAIVSIDHLSDTLTVWLAPKVFILEYATNLLK